MALKSKPERSFQTWRGRGSSKSFIGRVIIGVIPFRVLITLLITRSHGTLFIKLLEKPIQVQSLQAIGS